MKPIRDSVNQCIPLHIKLKNVIDINYIDSPYRKIFWFLVCTTSEIESLVSEQLREEGL